MEWPCGRIPLWKDGEHRRGRNAGKVLVSTLIIGMISGDSIQGSYASYDDNGILAKTRLRQQR